MSHTKITRNFIDSLVKSIDITKNNSVSELREHCKKLGIKGYSKKNKTDLLQMIINHK